MRRQIFCIALAAVFLLSACGGVSVIYKDAPADAPSEDIGATPEMDSPTPSNPQASAALESETDIPGEVPPQATPDTVGTAPPDDPMPAAGVESAAPAVSTMPAATPSDVDEQPLAPTPSSPTPGTGVLQPPLLSEMVSNAGLSFDDIGRSQLVLVAADKASADIYCYDKGSDGIWRLNETLGYIKGYAGRNGVNFDKHEGDGCSPGGLFGLSYAFGNSAKPETGLSWRAITKDTYWIDDPNSKYYNQWVENVDDADWTGGEHLSENVVSYAYAAVIDYNTAPNTVAGKGSAIFLHIGNKPTSGCVVVTKDTLLDILKWLTEDKNPGMLIVAK